MLHAPPSPLFLTIGMGDDFNFPSLGNARIEEICSRAVVKSVPYPCRVMT